MEEHFERAQDLFWVVCVQRKEKHQPYKYKYIYIYIYIYIYK